MDILGVFLFLLETSWTASLHSEHSFVLLPLLFELLEMGSKVKNVKGFFNASFRQSIKSL